jgi:hypothetical protein
MSKLDEKRRPLGILGVALAATLCLGAGSSTAYAQTPQQQPAALPPVPPATLLVPVGNAGAAPGLDDFDTIVARAYAFMREQQYERALVELQTAYSLRQRPILLLGIARVQQALGLAAEAVASYRRYLIAETAPAPAEQKEAEQAIARLSAFLPRPADAAPSAGVLPLRVETRPSHRGMIAAGWTLLSIGYAFAFGTGIGMGLVWNSYGGSSSYYASREPHSASGYTLLIPVLGPLISGITAPATAGSNGGLYAMIWTLPWLLTDLPMQIVGLALILQGRKTPQQTIVPNVLSRVNIRPYSSPTGGGLVAYGTF